MSSRTFDNDEFALGQPPPEGHTESALDKLIRHINSVRRNLCLMAIVLWKLNFPFSARLPESFGQKATVAVAAVAASV